MKHQKPRPQFKVNPHHATGSTTSKRGNQDSPNSQAPYGAGNGGRTRDTKLGKLVLYQLSYARTIFLNPEDVLKQQEYTHEQMKIVQSNTVVKL